MNDYQYELMTLASRLKTASEEFDRLVCSGPPDYEGNAMPCTEEEERVTSCVYDSLHRAFLELRESIPCEYVGSLWYNAKHTLGVWDGK